MSVELHFTFLDILVITLPICIISFITRKTTIVISSIFANSFIVLDEQGEIPISTSPHPTILICLFSWWWWCDMVWAWDARTIQVKKAFMLIILKRKRKRIIKLVFIFKPHENPVLLICGMSVVISKSSSTTKSTTSSFSSSSSSIYFPSLNGGNIWPAISYLPDILVCCLFIQSFYTHTPSVTPPSTSISSFSQSSFPSCPQSSLSHFFHGL